MFLNDLLNIFFGISCYLLASICADTDISVHQQIYRSMFNYIGQTLIQKARPWLNSAVYSFPSIVEIKMEKTAQRIETQVARQSLGNEGLKMKTASAY